MLLKKYKKGISIIETLLSLLMISVFIVLIINLSYSQRDYEKKYINKYAMYNNFYNIIQIIKSDPRFFEHVEWYYNIDGEVVHKINTSDNEKFYVSIYFDEKGLLTYQSNALYLLYIDLTLRDYSDYYDYYYYIYIKKSNVINTSTNSKGVYIHFIENK